MCDPARDLLLVANPRAGRGRVGRHLVQLSTAIRNAGLECQVLETAGAGHATELTRTAMEAGWANIVAVGGDGTVHEVVNALLDPATPPADRPVLGVIPVGSGCDFARTFGLPQTVQAQVAYLAGRHVLEIDAARVTLQTESGRTTRFFANIAEAGLGGDNVRRAEHLPRFLGQARYMVAFWLTLAQYRPCSVSVVSNSCSFEGTCNTVTVANGQFFGGGMWISPRSDPADGLLDVQISTGPKRQAVTLLPKIYRGTHLPNENTVEMIGASVQIDAEAPIPIEADGELLGTTPAEISVLPAAIHLRIPEASETGFSPTDYP